MHEHQTRYRWAIRGLSVGVLALGLVGPVGCGESESRPPAQEEFQRRHQADLMDRLDEIAEEEGKTAEEGGEAAETPSGPETTPAPEPAEPGPPGGV